MTTKKRRDQEVKVSDDQTARLIAASQRTEVFRIPELSTDSAALDQVIRELDRITIENQRPDETTAQMGERLGDQFFAKMDKMVRTAP